jgi:hypothetical protein
LHLVLGFVLAVSDIATARAAGQQIGPVCELVRDKVERGGAPSIAIAVVRGGRIVWDEGFG